MTARDAQALTPPIAETETTNERPEWLRIPRAVQLFGISRTKLYELIGDGHIKSVSLRQRGQIRGTRLLSFDSLVSYLEGLAEEQSGKD